MVPKIAEATVELRDDQRARKLSGIKLLLYDRNGVPWTEDRFRKASRRSAPAPSERRVVRPPSGVGLQGTHRGLGRSASRATRLRSTTPHPGDDALSHRHYRSEVPPSPATPSAASRASSKSTGWSTRRQRVTLSRSGWIGRGRDLRKVGRHFAASNSVLVPVLCTDLLTH